MNPWKRRLGNCICYPWCLMEAAGLEISCRTMGPWTCWCRRMRCRQPVQEKDDTAEQLSSRGDQGREEPARLRCREQRWCRGRRRRGGGNGIGGDAAQWPWMVGGPLECPDLAAPSCPRTPPESGNLQVTTTELSGAHR